MKQLDYLGKHHESGMSFLEVIFSIMILLVLSMTAASLIRSGVDLQINLSQQSKVKHRLSIAMEKLNHDIEHAFLLDSKRSEYAFTERKTKTHFSIKTRGESATLMLTAMNHRPVRQNSGEGDQTFIVYTVETDTDTGMQNLYRGETKFIPESFDDRIPKEIIAKNVKALRVKAWNGTDFKDAWNTERSEHRDLLPYMVEVEVEVYEDDPVEGERFEADSDLPTSTLRTVVYLARSWGFKQKRPPSKSIKYL